MSLTKAIANARENNPSQFIENIESELNRRLGNEMEEMRKQAAASLLKR
jgi:hypothetical protein